MIFGKKKKELEKKIQELEEKLERNEEKLDKKPSNSMNLLDPDVFANEIMKAKTKNDIETLYAKRKILKYVEKSNKISSNIPGKKEKIPDNDVNGDDMNVDDINELFSYLDKHPMLKTIINPILKSKLGIDLSSLREHPEMILNFLQNYVKNAKSQPEDKPPENTLELELETFRNELKSRSNK